MAISVKRITLWRKEVENQPGTLAATLAPFAESGVNLEVLMGYRFPGQETTAAIEVYPVAGAPALKAARAGGVKKSAIPTLLVQGDNRLGLGHAIASALAEAGINMGFLMAQVVGRRYSAVIGFEKAQDATRSAAIIKRIAARPAPRKKAARRPVRA